MGHGIGGVYWIGVVDEVRGRGIGELVTATLTNIAFEVGAPACTLQASAWASRCTAVSATGRCTTTRPFGVYRPEPEVGSNVASVDEMIDNGVSTPFSTIREANNNRS